MAEDMVAQTRSCEQANTLSYVITGRVDGHYIVLAVDCVDACIKDDRFVDGSLLYKSLTTTTGNEDVFALVEKFYKEFRLDFTILVARTCKIILRKRSGFGVLH